MKRIILYCLMLVSLAVLWTSCTKSLRQTVSLDGEWTIVKTAGEFPTGEFTSKVPVPGLVDLAMPAIDSAGTRYPDGWYWHKRQFKLKNTDFEKIELKIFKARYYTKVYINGKLVGENPYCFTPSYFDIKPYLLPAGQTNEIIIGIGNRTELPETVLDGSDGEKIKYIPGIYDHVEITLTNKPYINNIQCVPDIVNEKLRVVAEIETNSPANLELMYAVTEAASGKEVATQTFTPKTRTEGGFVIADFEIDMKGAKLWSPETPFLYELKLCTGADDKREKFGMRTFRFDPERKIALLNEKPYYLRGTNICIYRFFEDPDRGTLPWDKQWPITLHERFKDMNWSVMRYCIGFPPERWYDICDSVGFMLQDEFPLWGIRRKPNITAEHIAEEYRMWMRERWNHPSVVIWDAQNETTHDEIGKAIQLVRNLDLSNRPWENGWSAPMAETDPVESHPYLYGKYGGRNTPQPEEGYLKEFFGVVRRPANDASERLSIRNREEVFYDNPLIINEYGYIWLNRDGTTTTLTDRIYDNLWDGSNLTSQQRLDTYGRRLSELTEYWRAHRKVAGVLHFCGLAYSRSAAPRGQTSDHFVDINNLVFEPSFYKYVRSAFAPVGLMVDAWEKEYALGAKMTVPVYVINDLEQPFNHELQLSVMLNDQTVTTYKKEINVKPYEVLVVPFEIETPGRAGKYLLKGEYTLNEKNVYSIRDFAVSESGINPGIQAVSAGSTANQTITMTTALSGTVTIGFAGIQGAQATIDWGDNTQRQTISLTAKIKEYKHAYNNTTPRTITITGNINELVCNNNQLTSLDVSNNTMMELLRCDSNQLKSLDVSKLTKLINLSCANNQLTSLDVNRNVSDKTALTTLYAANNQLTGLDVGKTIMARLDIRNNRLSANGLNAFFESLPYSTAGGGSKVIYISGNPGTNTCNRNLASNTEWRVDVQ